MKTSEIMTRRTYHIIPTLLLLSCTLNLSAQKLIVTYVAGKVQRQDDGRNTAVTRSSTLQMGSVVNVPYEGKLELLDEANQKRYCIVKPGKSTIKQHIAAHGNTTMTASARYLAYLKSQIGDGAGSQQVQRAHVYTDYATVTRDSLVYLAERERRELENDINALPPRDRIRAKRTLNHQRHDAFRDSVIQQHLDFVRRAWTGRDVQAAIDRPIFNEVGPKIADPATTTTDRLKVADWFKGVITTIKDRTRITPALKHNDVPQPQPYLAIKEVDPILPADTITFPFECFGTKMNVRLDERGRVNIGKIDPNHVADALGRFSTDRYQNLISDCLHLREAHSMNDWAYFVMLQTLCDEYFGKGTNEATLLTGFLAYQSGYSIRFACDANQQQLFLLMKSKHVIYGRPYFHGSNPEDKYYIFGGECPKSILMCDAEYPNEHGLSLFIDRPLLLEEDPSPMREIRGLRRSENSVSIATNRNLMQFYDTYPSSEIDSNVCTRWAMYADTPLNPAVRDALYPQLQRLIAGKTQVEQVYTLMDLIHGIPYEYDEKMWGHDRTFFAEETLHYPASDCEDRAILLTRWVRDLLALPCALVYYPGHLATAIHFDGDVAGDRFIIDGETYTVCDPTYLGAPVGMQMPNLEGERAQLILLE